MKRPLILALIVLTLFSYGAAQQQQKLSNEKLTSDDALPELVFEDFDFEKSIHSGSNVIPQTLQNATRIVFNKELVKFSDGTNEIAVPVDLEESFEDVGSDGHYFWIFVVKENANLPKVHNITIETSYPVEDMENIEPIMGAEYAPLKITVGDVGNYYPKRFKQWKALKRKMLPSFPTNAEYYGNLDWASHDHSPEGLEDYHQSTYIDMDINQDGIDDVVAFNYESLCIYFFDAENAVISEKTFKVQNEFAKSRIENVVCHPDGDMVIRTEWINNRGASGSDNYTAHYQDDDLYLIGYDCHYQPSTFETYNLLTYTKEKESGLIGDDKKTTTTLKKLPLKKLSDIKIGEYNCNDYE